MSRIKGQVSQEILGRLRQQGSVIISPDSGRFWPQLFARLFPKEKIPGRVVKDSFYYLKKQGLIAGRVREGQVHIHLTPAGEDEAHQYRLRNLKVAPHKTWDKKWRLVFLKAFDDQVKRRRLIKKMKEMGFYALAKNLWVFPHDCADEINLLRDFFALGRSDLRLLETDEIEDDGFLQDFFHLPR